MKAEIFLQRSSTDEESPRRMTSQTRSENQISIRPRARFGSDVKDESMGGMALVKNPATLQPDCVDMAYRT